MTGRPATPVGDAPLCFVDLEMTGLDPAVDRVVEIAILRHVGRAPSRELVSLVRPDRAAGRGSEIHGIPEEALLAAPAFADLADDVTDVLRDTIVVGHGVEMDAAFLAMELERAGRPPLEIRLLDTLVLSRRCLGLPRSRLEDVAARLGIPFAEAHRARPDAEATRDVFFALAELLEAKTIEDLEAVRIGEGLARPEIVEALARAVAAKTPVRIRYRPARHGPMELVMVLTVLRTDETPPRVVGYDTSTRSRRELRADRVLGVQPID